MKAATQDETSPGKPLPLRAGIFIAATSSIGIAVTVAALAHWHSSDPLRFLCFLAIALLVSGFKVDLPGIDGSMSVNFVFILLGMEPGAFLSRDARYWVRVESYAMSLASEAWADTFQNHF